MPVEGRLAVLLLLMRGASAAAGMERTACMTLLISSVVYRSEVAVTEEARDVAEDSVDGGVPGANEPETRS